MYASFIKDPTFRKLNIAFNPRQPRSKKGSHQHKNGAQISFYDTCSTYPGDLASLRLTIITLSSHTNVIINSKSTQDFPI